MTRFKSQVWLTTFKLIFWAALIFAFVMAILPKPPVLPGEPSDKIQHILAFLTPTVLALCAYRDARYRVIFVGLFLFGGLIELVQTIPVLNRSASLQDWAADIAAVAVILLLAKTKDYILKRQ